jgi:oligopeptidase A
MSHPLLDDYALPPFDAIDPATVPEALDAALAENEREIEAVARRAADGSVGWDDVVPPLEAASDRLARLWSPVRHLHSVADSEALRATYEDGLPKLTDYGTRYGQHRGLHAAWQALADAPDFATWPVERRTAVEHALRDFRRSGVALPEAERARYAEISQRLSELGNRYAQNLMDATDAWSVTVPEDRLAGLPDAVRERALGEARDAGQPGGLLRLDGPTYLAVLSHAEDASLRRTFYEAWSTRASAPGPDRQDWDNAPLIEEILALRHEQAQLLGHGSWAERQLEARMAETPETVLGFLHDLAERAVPQARAELDELRTWAREHLGMDTLEVWDVPFAAERLRHERYAVSQEQLRPWFPVDRVVSGLFDIVRRLFDVDVVEVHDWPTWHDDVRTFELRRDGEPVGRFYLDLYARRHKRGGAWMDGCLGRRRTESGVQVPVAFLTCNFGGPVGDGPACLTHDEVTTLFHEFGHGLHHMLTQVDVADVAGINGVPWDAVELPSQFLENWCWHPESLALISGHRDTGEPLPAELLERLLAARNFHSAMAMVRQLEFSLFDFRLHHEYDPDESDQVRRVLDEVRDAVAVTKPPEWNRFENGFQHVFAGGYSAGYYSYKWAEVLSADAFSRFEENGIFDAQSGNAFLEHVLEKGGSEPPAELFRRFRGRDPDIAALLRHTGIVGGSGSPEPAPAEAS